jgi:YcxB-like protein
MLTELAFRPGNEMHPVSLAILVLVWLVLLTSQIAQRAWTELRFSKISGKEIWYEFDETGGLANGESRLKWPAISNFNDTNTLFVVMESGVLFCTIPKRALAADDISSLRQLLMEKVPSSGSWR